MEVAKVKTPSAVYQGSGPEAVAKPEAVKIDTVVKPEMAAKPEKKVSEARPDKNAVPQKGIVSGEEEKSVADSQEALNNKKVRRAVEEVNRKAKNNELIFGVHDATNRVTIKVVDKSTKEVIREFPPEETLDMIAKVWELAGIMVDERG